MAEEKKLFSDPRWNDSSGISIGHREITKEEKEEAGEFLVRIFRKKGFSEEKIKRIMEEREEMIEKQSNQ